MDKLAATARARIAILELMKFLLSYFGVTIAMFLCMTRCVLAAEKKGIILLLMAINNYLDQLRIAGYLTINRTAGLDMVYVESPMKPQDIMTEYYTKAQVR